MSFKPLVALLGLDESRHVRPGLNELWDLVGGFR
jgi:hypothetical protein